jgi:AraC family transcriptional regulator of adaptative response/methylated-DNA-[protein]-cysteine methyltransferase
METSRSTANPSGSPEGWGATKSPSRAEALRAIRARDARQDGRFVYGVTTTGVYCRPSCRSRPARSEHIAIFAGAADAQSAGFRACKRCYGMTAGRAAVARALRILRESPELGTTELRLGELARRVGLSPFHLQRLFRQEHGMSPSELGRALRDRRWRHQLQTAPSVTHALVEAGFSSTSRAHDSSELGATPSEYRRGMPRGEIRYAFVTTPFGRALVARTLRGICHLGLAGSDEADGALLRELAREYPRAQLFHDERELRPVVRTLLSAMKGSEGAARLPLDIAGTVFQRRVWRALTRIPRGETRTYGQIAKSLQLPRAARAVASACARNRVAILVPCHRVVRGDGGLGGYRWGLARKSRILVAEHRDSPKPRASRKTRR